MAASVNILHIFRAPVGGLFRHVRDLAAAQARLGHAVGLVCDAAGDRLTQQRLDDLAPHCTLGIHRLPMRRDLSPLDARSIGMIRHLARRLGVDVLHGHGAKGGAFARLAAPRASGCHAFYTPHGGSLHYDPRRAKGRIYMALERRMARRTAGIIFESRFAADTYMRNVGPTSTPVRVIHNGLSAADFECVRQADDAADVVFVGELRLLKGVDVLLEALARVPAATAVIVGDGPDAARFRAQALNLGLGGRVRFTGALPARNAFALGRILVVPSRAESLPYVVLEGAAAGLPVIATDVGGIPEIFAGTATSLVAPGDAAALESALRTALAEPEALQAAAHRLRSRVEDHFSADVMTRGVLGFYGVALQRSIGINPNQSLQQAVG